VNLVVSLSDPSRMREKTYVETSGFPGWRYQIPLSGAVFVFSSMTLALLSGSEHAPEEVVPALVAVCLSFIIVGLPQFLEFRRISQEIVSSGISRKSGDPTGRDQVRVGLGVVVLFMMVLGPLFLSFFVPPLIWFGSVLGMIIGLSSSQITFSLYVRRWEKAHGVKLSRFTVWLRDERNRKVVIEYGVRSERR